MKRTILSIMAMLCLTMAVAQQKSHTILRGETIESIAKKYNISVYALKQANPDVDEMFYVGMKLTIPEGGTYGSEGASPLGVAQTSPNYYQQDDFSTNGGDDSDSDRLFLAGRVGYTSIMEIPDKGKTFTMPGFRVGIDVVYALTYNWHATAGLCAKFGYKDKDKITNDMFSLVFPVNIGYKLPVSDKVGLVLRAGPYLDYVFSRTQKVGNVKLKFTKEKEYNKMAAGVNASIAVMVNGYGIFGEFGMGLTDRIKKTKENYWSVGINANF